MAEFRFTNEHPSGETGRIIEVLRRPRLWIPTRRDYPDFDSWLIKTEAHIRDGSKRAMLAYMGRQPVGAIIYQEHETRPGAINIRNISVSPDAQGRYVGSFLLRNTEIEAAQHDFPGCSEMVVDTKVSNAGMVGFLAAAGYNIEAVEDLYGLGSGLDAILEKSLTTA